MSEGRKDHTVASGLLDGSDVHNWVGPGEDLCCLHKRVVVVVGDDEEARYLLDGLREGALRDAHICLRSALDRPCFAAVGEPCAAGHRAATRFEQLGELVVGVECGLMISLRAGIPFCLVVSGEHDDVVGHDASCRWWPDIGMTSGVLSRFDTRYGNRTPTPTTHRCPQLPGGARS